MKKWTVKFWNIMTEYDILYGMPRIALQVRGGKGERGEKSVCLNWNGWGLDLTVRQTHTRPLNDQKSDAKMHFASHK